MSESVAADKARHRRSARSLIVILVLGVVGALILTFRAKLRGPTSPEDVLEHLVELRDNVALVAFAVDAKGAPDPSASTIAHNAEVKMPLAAISRVPVLLAYAKAVGAGHVSAETPVDVRDWERHYLPGNDGGAHGKALKAFRLKTTQNGFAADPNTKVTLDQVVQAMITHNDYAAADYLLKRLGEDEVNEVARDAGLNNHDAILPMSGLFLLASAAKDEAGARALLAKDPQAFAQAVRDAAAAFDKNVAGTPAQQTWTDAYPTPAAGVQSLWSDRAMTQGTAGQYAAMLARVATGHWGTAVESEIVKRHLGWPLALEGNADLFTAFGGKGGTLVSIMTEAMYVVPKHGDFQGQTRVVVLLQRRMPMLRWFALVRSFAHQQFMLKVAVDRSFAESAKQALTAPTR